MLIKRIQIRNFRSIKELDLEIDRPLVILSGANDVGKSNILLAIDLAFRHAALELLKDVDQKIARPDPWPGRPLEQMQPTSIFRRKTQSPATAAISFALNKEEQATLDTPSEMDMTVEWTRAASDTVLWKLGGPALKNRVGLGRFLADAVRHVSTRRMPLHEGFNSNEQTPQWTGDNLKRLLFAYKNDASPQVQARFDVLREQCADEPLIGGLVVGASGNNLFIKTESKDSEVFDIEERSTGTQQLIFLLALALCHRGRVLIIEEPELNLSSTLPRVGWRRLSSLVGGMGPLDQLIVSSHSHVFEAEAERVRVTRDDSGDTTAAWTAPPSVNPSVTTVPLGAGGEIILPASLMEELKINPGSTLFLETDSQGIHVMSAEQWATSLRQGTEP